MANFADQFVSAQFIKGVFMFISTYVAKKSNGEYLSLSIEVGSPTFDNGDFRCQLRIAALGIDEQIFGVDGMQAYCMTNKRLEFHLRAMLENGYKLYFPEHLDAELDVLSFYF